MELLRSIINGANRISTPPNKASYYWRDSFSILSWIVLHAIYLERLLSCLQWCKCLYRAFHSDSKDPASKRPNVPSWVVELYYVVVLCLMTIAVLYLRESSCWLKGFVYYFFIDSTVWVLYYFFFRRFFEEKYAIMHSLEYIVVLPLVILSQAKEIIIITDWKYSVGECVSMLINPNWGTPVPILLVSVLYVAVIFGLIISNLPIENIKEKGDYHYHLLIIGYGNVVKDRLQKAIRARFIQKELKKEKKNFFNVAFYDPKTIEREESKRPFRKYHEQYFKLEESHKQKSEDFEKDILRSNIVWIATPPSSHFKYLEHYCRTNPLVVVEKPASVYRQEFEAIKAMRRIGRDNVFYLSYYILEKALPLTFLYRPLEFYERYLNFHGRTRQELLSTFSSLGRVKGIDMRLIEMNDSREWAFSPEEGGQLFETFIHPACITRLVLGLLPPIEESTIKARRDENGRIIGISLKSVFSGHTTHLRFEKQTDKKERKVKIKYEHGQIIMDMDKRELTLRGRGNKDITISIASPYDIHYENEKTVGNYNSEYTVQLDMVLRCFGERISPSSIDCSDIQFCALDWLFELSEMPPFS